MPKMFDTVDKHPRFTSLISHTTSIRLGRLSRNAEKSFVSTIISKLLNSSNWVTMFSVVCSGITKHLSQGEDVAERGPLATVRGR